MFLSSRRGNLSSGPLLGPGGAEPGQLETLSSGFSHLRPIRAARLLG